MVSLSLSSLNSYHGSQSNLAPVFLQGSTMNSSNDNPFDDGKANTAVLSEPKHTGPESLKHHYLVSGEVMVAEDAGLASIRMNTVLLTNAPRVTARDIGEAQKSLQHQFFKRHEIGNSGGSPQVVDVFIVSLSYLGHMKPSTFTNLNEPAKKG
jgi:hypothetical protein